MKNNYCRFCANDIDDNNLIWKDSFQLCESCYTELFNCKNDYDKNLLLSRKIKTLSSTVNCLRQEKYDF